MVATCGQDVAVGVGGGGWSMSYCMVVEWMLRVDAESGC